MWATIKEWWQAMVDFFYRIFLSFVDFMKDFLWFVLDALMSAGIAVLGTVGEGLEALNPLQYITAIPSETQAMMAQTGFNEAMSIIVAAILIRFILQLIPFVRWGS